MNNRGGCSFFLLQILVLVVVISVIVPRCKKELPQQPVKKVDRPRGGGFFMRRFEIFFL